MKRILFPALVLVLILGLFACQQKPPVPPEPEDALYVLNPLTGETTLAKDRAGERIFAVDINNIEASLPQYGVSEADVIFEFETEGGITRFLCLFSDVRGICHIGSIRSYRLYFLDVCMPLDALLIHWGVASFDAFTKAQYDDYSSLSADLFPELIVDEPARDKPYAFEHSRFVSGDTIESFYKNHPSLNRPSKFPGTLFRFLPDGEAVTPENTANSVYFPFSALHVDPSVQNDRDHPYQYDGDLRYDAESEMYLKYQHGELQVDAGNGNAPLAFKNVLILLTAVEPMGDSPWLKDFRFEYGGEGYYLTNGHSQKIFWMKEGSDGNFQLYDAETEQALFLNPGKSFVACIDNEVSDYVVLR